ncbi:hypothetical protein ACFX2I_000722 [Malus domestica]
MSPPPSPIGRVLRQRHNLLQRSRQRRRQRRVTANRARSFEPEPRVEAQQVEVVPALGHHPEHLGVLVVAEADGARGRIGGRRLLGKREPGVGIDDARVEPDDGVPIIILLLLLVVVFGDEDDAGEDDAFGARIRVLGLRRVVVVVAVAGDAAADVGGEEEGGEEDEEAERNGDAVAEAEGS